jgi:branched-chain amino acid transport system substrate-binding protein
MPSVEARHSPARKRSLMRRLLTSINMWRIAWLAALLLSIAVASWADPGVTATEIKIGNTAPYSGPASATATIFRAIAAYFTMVNDHGGIGAHQVRFISYDDGYSPPRTVEMTRKLVERDHVFFIAASAGTPTSTAVWKYLNDRKVPQLFLVSGDAKWGDPQHHPWTMGWLPTYQGEGEIYGRYVREHIPDAKIGVLYQNDDFGRSYLSGFRQGLGERASKLIAMEQTYEVTDPTIDSQIVHLAGSGANVFFDVTTPKFAAQAIKKMHALGWHPVHFLDSLSASLGSTLKPAGYQAATGIITTQFVKDPSDPRWHDDPAYKEWLTFMHRYYPAGDVSDQYNVWGYTIGQTIAYVLKQCGDDLSRSNLMRQAANIKDLTLPMLLPGIKINTSPTRFYPITQEQLARFDGTRWVLLGELYDTSAALSTNR